MEGPKTMVLFDRVFAPLSAIRRSSGLRFPWVWDSPFLGRFSFIGSGIERGGSRSKRKRMISRRMKAEERVIVDQRKGNGYGRVARGRHIAIVPITVHVSNSRYFRQVQVMSTLPLKAVSRIWGRFNELQIPYYLRVPGFRLYSWIFGVK